MNRPHGRDYSKPAGRLYGVALLIMLVFLIFIRLTEVYIYPGSVIIPPDFFLIAVIIQMFFLWLYTVREKERILWIEKKREELGEMKSKFTLITSHELMTPITVIKGYMKLMMDRALGELTPKQKNALDVMNKYFERLETIKSNLTRLSSEKPESIEKNLKQASIESIIRTTAEDMGTFLNKRRQHLELQIERGMPDIDIDINGIRQVLANLLLNAIRFTPDNGRITIRAKDDKDNIRVEVEDNGIGIPGESLKSIFESFYEVQDIRKHSSGSIEFKSSGIGLGLTIAKKIIDFHNGRIWAESEVDKFSRFIFTLAKKQRK